ncbi:MAG: protein translocase subunit SecF [Candidatus Thiodiazotropha sp. (ex Myrtea spinifera)]|nr:protein translocase subunit SecF [Candidatus Thiodiazotropha sp. (ex Myrtea spinifera)]MCU7827592.1 protein translocase subunit SecF [Candidatus Thiodiazotropha sp. (ex Myrtea sp. 'scaly one' KF741663)]
MQLFKRETHIDFMGKRKLAMILSILLIVVALGSIVAKGLNLGIDFTGGTLVEVGFPAAVELPSVREKLSAEGFGDAVVQHFGTSRDVLIRLAPQEDVESAELSDHAFSAMQGLESSADLRRVEFVGPQVGDELTEDGGLAMLYALIGILIYVGLRFEYRFAVGAVIALIHDVIITIGIFSLFQVEFDLPVLAAVLAVIGYSLNDTIVVYDRIRENFRKIRKGDSKTIINSSLNQTLSRTLVTSMTTLLVLLSLFFFGGEIIHGFALALIVGVVVGTYSSIYVAGSAILMMGVSKADLMPVKKEDETADEMP